MRRILQRLNQRTTLRLIAGMVVVVCFFLAYADWMVRKNAQNKTFDSVKNTPGFRTGLVLGTLKFLRSGRINLYYKHRIDATMQLWKAGKIKPRKRIRKSIPSQTCFKSEASPPFLLYPWRCYEFRIKGADFLHVRLSLRSSNALSGFKTRFD